jgi:hypothetical protein
MWNKWYINATGSLNTILEKKTLVEFVLLWRFKLRSLYRFEATWPGSGLLHLMKNSFPSQIQFVLPSIVWVAFVIYCHIYQALAQVTVKKKKNNRELSASSTFRAITRNKWNTEARYRTDIRKPRGNVIVKRLTCSVDWKLSLSFFPWVELTFPQFALLHSVTCVQFRLIRIHGNCGCVAVNQFPWCAHAVTGAGACAFSYVNISDVRLATVTLKNVADFSCYVTYGHSKINVHKLKVIPKRDIVEGLRDIGMKLRFISATEKSQVIKKLTMRRGHSPMRYVNRLSQYRRFGNRLDWQSCISRCKRLQRLLCHGSSSICLSLTASCYCIT